MKVGLFFGTFNPIHVGHLALAQRIAELDTIDKVWFVVTPKSPFKANDKLLPDFQRRDMVYQAIEDNPLFQVSDVEFGLPQPNYTAHTLAHLSESQPEHTFSLIVGEDNLRSFRKWKNWDWILEHYKLLVYPRVQQSAGGPDKTPWWKDHASIELFDAPVIQISASAIRKEIAAGRGARYLLTDPVYKYIDEMGLYR